MLVPVLVDVLEMDDLEDNTDVVESVEGLRLVPDPALTAVSNDISEGLRGGN